MRTDTRVNPTICSDIAHLHAEENFLITLERDLTLGDCPQYDTAKEQTRALDGPDRTR